MYINVEKLRNRPKEDRQMIAVVSSGATVAVLLLGWGISMTGMFSAISESQTAAVAASDQNSVQQTPSLNSSFRAVPTPNIGEQATSSVETGTIVTIPTDQ